MGKVITISVQKGGVGKTTTAVNLAAEFAIHGYETLLIDMDKQGNATFMVTGKRKNEFNGRALYDMFCNIGKKSIKEYIIDTDTDKLHLLPSSEYTNQILNQLVYLKQKYGRAEYTYLNSCIGDIISKYDYIIIDTPPTENNLAISGIYAADEVIVPVRADSFSIDSFIETYAIIKKLNTECDNSINLLGILITMTEKVSLLKIIEDNICEGDYGKDLLKTKIRKGQAVNDSTMYGQPVVITDRRSHPAKDYAELYKEIKEKMQHHNRIKKYIKILN
jgi:chromosome partitioning protein